MFTISSVYKARGDGPGWVTSEDLRLPLDQDMRKLNGTLRVDLGIARFQANGDLFSGLLRVLGERGGPIGRRVAPFVVRIASGVARFDDVEVPLGEFTCSSSGSIDMVHDLLDVLVWIPAGQVTDEALGPLKLGLGGMVNRLVPLPKGAQILIPFRVKGPIASPSEPRADAGLFLERFGTRLVQAPARVLDALPVPKPSGKP